MQKTFLHLGAHKTATTFIQKNLISNRPQIEAQGWKVIHLQTDNRSISNIFRRMRSVKKIGPKGRSKVKLFFEQLNAEPMDIFFSSEIPLGSMSIKSGALYPNHVNMIRRIRRGIKRREVVVGFCVRNFADYIESSYAYLVSQGADYSFKHYIKELSDENLSWVSILQELSDNFGAENLRLWTYEDFRRDSADAFLKIMEAATIDSTKLSVPVTGATNPGIPQDAIPLAQQWNALIDSRKDFSAAKIRELRKSMQNLLASLKTNAPSNPLSAERRELLNARYEAELSLIREKWPNALISFAASPIDEPDKDESGTPLAKGETPA